MKRNIPTVIQNYKIVRLCVEVFLAATAGMVVVVLPILIGGEHRHNSAVFIPVIGNAVEDVKLYTLGFLFVLGLVIGIFGRAPVLLVGSATMLAFPIWSLIDMLVGGTGHDLWPMEWFFYGVESLPGLAGAVIGRVAKRWWIKRRSLHNN